MVWSYALIHQASSFRLQPNSRSNTKIATGSTLAKLDSVDFEVTHSFHNGPTLHISVEDPSTENVWRMIHKVADEVSRESHVDCSPKDVRLFKESQIWTFQDAEQRPFKECMRGDRGILQYALAVDPMDNFRKLRERSKNVLLEQYSPSEPNLRSDLFEKLAQQVYEDTSEFAELVDTVYKVVPEVEKVKFARVDLRFAQESCDRLQSELARVSDQVAAARKEQQAWKRSTDNYNHWLGVFRKSPDKSQRGQESHDPRSHSSSGQQIVVEGARDAGCSSWWCSSPKIWPWSRPTLKDPKHPKDHVQARGKNEMTAKPPEETRQRPTANHEAVNEAIAPLAKLQALEREVEKWWDYGFGHPLSDDDRQELRREITFWDDIYKTQRFAETLKEVEQQLLQLNARMSDAESKLRKKQDEARTKSDSLEMWIGTYARRIPEDFREALTDLVVITSGIIHRCKESSCMRGMAEPRGPKQQSAQDRRKQLEQTLSTQSKLSWLAPKLSKEQRTPWSQDLGKRIRKANQNLVELFARS